MCGIIGYVGPKEAVPILLDGLKKLEYRGYDSSGVGIVAAKDGKISIRKSEGKIQNLISLIKKNKLPESFVGISHTRWATHGVPNRVNAHPHFDCSKRILVVHNGIIENYQELKAELQEKGHQFSSQTDTEVVSHLIEECNHNNGDITSAVKEAIKKLKGAFALGIITSDDPQTLIAVRVGSPLIIGVGEGEYFIASDVPAILDQTKKIIYLKDEEIAFIKRDDLKLFSFDGKPVSAKVDVVSFTVGSAQKEGYPHFMLKEIHEQPKVLSQMISSHIRDSQISFDAAYFNPRDLEPAEQIMIVACGTAYHAGMVGKYIIEQLARIPVVVDVSSEFRYRSPIVNRKTLMIAVSQSGETADTLAAVKEAKAKGAKIISICNVVGSSLARESDGVLYTHAGPEIGVASTKAYTAQLGMFYLLALKLASIKRQISAEALDELIRDFERVPFLYEEILKTKSSIARMARSNSHFGCFLFLGRNVNFPSALEGALKLKEISYIPAEGYAAGEMKHGPIALIDEYRAVVCIAPHSDTYEKMISNMQEIRSRKGKIIVIATKGDTTIKQHAHHVVYIPPIHQLLTPLLVALPLQMIAYYIATRRGCDVDQPRNLAKSVTVE